MKTKPKNRFDADAAHEHTLLQPTDYEAFFAALDNPPAPSPKLRDAFEREEAATAKAQGLIEWAMEVEGISQRELADRLGISQAEISQLLGLSPTNLSVKQLARVLYALGDTLTISTEKRKAFLIERKEAREAKEWSNELNGKNYDNCKRP